MKKVKLDPNELTYDGKGLSIVVKDEASFNAKLKAKKEELKKKMFSGVVMKKVIELGQLREIPEDYKCCSVCGIHFPVTSFNNDNSSTPTRTNCKGCYESPQSDWNERIQKKQSAQMSEEAKKYLKEKKIEGVSVSVEELISQLQKLPKDSKIVMTQDGYYACGDFADIHTPIPLEGYEDINVYKIGHSSQNY